MSSSTKTSPVAANLKALAAAELAAAVAPVQEALTAVQESDGSIAAVTAQGVVLLGHFQAILPTLQKIGFTGLAADLNQFLTDWVAKTTTNLEAAKTAEKTTSSASTDSAS